MPRLTKRLFLSWKTCPRQGWLLLHRTGSADLSLGEQFRIEQGIEIGKKARELFPEGILIEQKATGDAARRTQELLADPSVHTLFEAAFRYGDYTARADVLVRTVAGWEMTEVKSATGKKVTGTNGKAKDAEKNRELSDLIDDMAYTTLIAKKNGMDFSHMRLMLVAEKFELKMAPEKLFETFDFTDEVRRRAAGFEGMLEQAAAVLGQAGEPAFSLKKDCRSCEFFEHCIPPTTEYTIFDIPRLSEKQMLELYGKGIVLVRDIPEDFRLTETQKLPVECMRTGRTLIAEGLRSELKKVRWPAHYLDFETTQTAYPLYGKVHPYEKIPTQYSVHTCTGCGEVLRHREYLADPARDCRRELAESLIRDLDGDGSVLSYSSYEAQVIKGLIERFPDLKEPLNSIIARLVDLIDCAKCTNHPAFKGSNSIKVVLPVLVPEMSYDGMPIANGEDAMVTFAWMARGKYTPEECEKKRQEMLAYCRLDTLAMVKIHAVFAGMAGE